MSERLGFGAAIGAIVSAVVWNANPAPNTVSIFPDVLTLVILAALTYGAVWLHFRHAQPQSIAGAVKAGGTIAATTGFVFGTAMVALGAMRFTQPFPTLLAFGFMTAFASSLVCGVAASALAWRKEPLRAS